MPLLIDRYLLRQFFRTFLIFFCSFTGLYMVIDALSNLDHFLALAERTGSLFGVLTAYYGIRTFWFFDTTSGILALISVMFTVTGFQRHNEMTALMAAGISKRRIVSGVIAAAVAVSLLALVNREFLLPNFREKLARDARNWHGEQAASLKPRYDNRTNVLIGGASIVPAEKRIDEPSFRMPYALQEHGTTFAGEAAHFVPARDDRPAGYLIDKVRQPKDLAGRSSLKLDDELVVVLPRDADWLQPDQCFVVSDVSFEQLEAGNTWQQFASTRELIAGLRNESLDFGADVRVSIHHRLIKPILDVSLIFLGLPLILTRENRNAFLAIGLCALVVLGYMTVVIACHWLGGASYISPARAAWLPVAIFVPLAVYLSEPLRE